MTKAELSAIIMANTDQYKKTHLKKMHLAELEAVAAPYLLATMSEDTAEPESADQPETTDAPEVAEEPTTDTSELAVVEMIAQAYEENAKLIKGPRLDREEFRETVIEKVQALLSGTESMDDIRASVVTAINMLLQDRVAFCPINDTERQMLATIPLLPDFTGVGSVMDGKGFLKKVEELHGVKIATSRALMVSLMKKKYFQIIGVRSGQKHTTIKLLDRGIRYLDKNGLLADQAQSA